VCRIADVAPGELRGFQVPGVTWPVMVTIVDGAMVAFPGVCPHDDVSLVDYGVLDRSDAGEPELRCRVHGYRFELATGRCEHMPGLQLRRYRITLSGDDVLVDLL
jgi:nitrite reductase/ring-hydroxylating ferredoxin subunit